MMPRPSNDPVTKYKILLQQVLDACASSFCSCTKPIHSHIMFTLLKKEVIGKQFLCTNIWMKIRVLL